MDDIGRWVWRFFGRFVGASDEASADAAATHDAAAAASTATNLPKPATSAIAAADTGATKLAAE